MLYHISISLLYHYFPRSAISNLNSAGKIAKKKSLAITLSFWCTLFDFNPFYLREYLKKKTVGKRLFHTLDYNSEISTNLKELFVPVIAHNIMLYHIIISLLYHRK